MDKSWNADDDSDMDAMAKDLARKSGHQPQANNATKAAPASNSTSSEKTANGTAVANKTDSVKDHVADSAAVALSSTIGETSKHKEEPVLIIKNGLDTPKPALTQTRSAPKANKPLVASFLTERFNAIFKQ